MQEGTLSDVQEPAEWLLPVPGHPCLEGRLQGGGKWLYFLFSMGDVKESLKIAGSWLWWK